MQIRVVAVKLTGVAGAAVLVVVVVVVVVAVVVAVDCHILGRNRHYHHQVRQKFTI
jgi:hypothetical protein